MSGDRGIAWWQVAFNGLVIYILAVIPRPLQAQVSFDQH